jgi:hypothetical protein
MTDDRMTSAERNSLLVLVLVLVLVRQGERVAKTDAAEYAATLLADFEAKLAAVYYPSDHPAWKTARKAADRAVAEANAAVAEVCRELGIPKAFAPGISAGWCSRGANASNERRSELRRVAKTEIEARVKRAQAAIARASVGAQERIIAAGLTSEAARALLAELPTPQQLLPNLDVGAIEPLAGPLRTRDE